MIIIRDEHDAQRLLDLALEIQEVEQIGWQAALHKAVNLVPQLACDIENDRRYESWEIHTSFSVPPMPQPVTIERVRVDAAGRVAVASE